MRAYISCICACVLNIGDQNICQYTNRTQIVSHYTERGLGRLQKSASLVIAILVLVRFQQYSIDRS